MLIRTSELIGNALAWAAGVAEGYEMSVYGVTPELRARVPGLGVHAPWNPTRYWNQAGVIIEREEIALYKMPSEWAAEFPQEGSARTLQNLTPASVGPTPLIAAMRCYVTSKLGDEVEIPEGLK